MIKTNIEVETSNRNLETYNGALALSRLFPTHTQVCRRMARSGINPRDHVVTGECGEVIQDAGLTFLASIHAEIGDSEMHATAAEREWLDAQDVKALEAGPSLTTICNTKDEHVSVTDTMDSVAALFVKYLRNAQPLDDFTDEENREGEVAMAASIRARQSGMTDDEATEAVAKALASKFRPEETRRAGLTPYALKLLARK